MPCTGRTTTLPAARTSVTKSPTFGTPERRWAVTCCDYSIEEFLLSEVEGSTAVQGVFVAKPLFCGGPSRRTLQIGYQSGSWRMTLRTLIACELEKDLLTIRMSTTQQFCT